MDSRVRRSACRCMVGGPRASAIAGGARTTSPPGPVSNGNISAHLGRRACAAAARTPHHAQDLRHLGQPDEDGVDRPILTAWGLARSIPGALVARGFRSASAPCGFRRIGVRCAISCSDSVSCPRSSSNEAVDGALRILRDLRPPLIWRGSHRRFSTWRVACAERGITRPFTATLRASAGSSFFSFSGPRSSATSAFARLTPTVATRSAPSQASAHWDRCTFTPIISISRSSTATSRSGHIWRHRVDRTSQSRHAAYPLSGWRSRPAGARTLPLWLATAGAHQSPGAYADVLLAGGRKPAARVQLVNGLEEFLPESCVERSQAGKIRSRRHATLACPHRGRRNRFSQGRRRAACRHRATRGQHQFPSRDRECARHPARTREVPLLPT